MKNDYKSMLKYFNCVIILIYINICQLYNSIFYKQFNKYYFKINIANLLYNYEFYNY